MKGYGMKAANQAGWFEVDKPIAGDLDAILRPIVTAPCSSDTHVLHRGYGPDVKNIILGHEAVGEIVEVGKLVKNFKQGDIVVVPCCTPDFLDKEVQGTGWSNAHDNGKRFFSSFKFLSQKHGVWGEFFHVNLADANLTLLPDGIAPEAALMAVDMMSTGFHCVENAEIEFGDSVVVIGIGPVGLMCVAGAKLKGAGRILAAGTRPNCIAAAKEYGATDIINYKNGDIVEQTIDLLKGKADRVIIAGGGQETLLQALKMTKPGGIVSNVNFFDNKDTFTIPAEAWGLGMGNITIRGDFCPGGAKRIEKMLEIIKYRVDTTKLITHRFEGFDKIEDAANLMEEKPADLIKPVVFIKW
ncbi:MAG: zinc-binding dehydrogenase [Elusimicrobiota bacterium]|jgi:threonine dehydrogenase-like Zn-dependent dehydrogenase|nr:zinc-binding dehydrogenase [Elusimicrobiota bacterium]